MIAISSPHPAQTADPPSLRAGLKPLLAPLPLFVVQKLLDRIVAHIAQKRPGLFRRVADHRDKLFLIDPLNLPFALVLRADPDAPELRAFRRRHLPATQARIAGSFLTLLGMIEGNLDGDALFFTRDLTVEGDTEAIVCLRNALDDVDGSIAEDTAEVFGAPGRLGLEFLRKIRTHAHP